MPDFQAFRRSIDRCMIVDRFRLRSQLQLLQKQWGEGPVETNPKYQSLLDSFISDLKTSQERVEWRRQVQPKIQYDAELPVVQRKDEIARLIRENQVIVLSGETGTGKSTQLPKICLELGLGLYGMIGHTQPRRIAARSIAARIAEELQTPLGQIIGYKVRFADETGPKTFVKLMTDGILLAESQNDRFFDQYEVIIIDEAHERSLNIDFLLGMMKRLLLKRRDLKLIITSATIDAKRFASHFGTATGPAPILEIESRTFPIDIRYRPYDESQKGEEEPDEERALLDAVNELAYEGRGDMLIFMPTERDIFETAKLLRHHVIPGDDAARKTEILPLYARLSVAEQQRVFKPHSHRRIVIATNVAESSLTVPGIRYVIDPGTARISRYSARSKTQRLPIEAISRASADQRAGRCGRIGPGICIRLYSQEDYELRDRYTTPEIQRTNLASVILQTKSLQLGAIETFPFLDPPRISAIQDGYKTLFELGALDSRNDLTSIGRQLSQLPVDPRIARMILAAEKEGVLREMLIIASVLEIQDPRERPIDLQEKADSAHVRFLDEQSDFMSYLKIWDFYQELKNSLSRNQLRKACVQNFLSFNRMKEWTDIHVQLLQLVREAKLQLNSRKDDYKSIHRSILTGLLSGIANRDEKNEYTITGGGKFVLWPGSGLMKRPVQEDAQRKKQPENQPGKPKWVVASERLETSRRFLRTVARIDVDWIEPLAQHMITRSYLEPHWNGETGYVHAYEKVSLFGLVIIPKRRINYGPIDPKNSRELFIQNGLVEEDMQTTADFFEYNRMMLEEAKKLQDKLRHHDLLRGQWSRYEFYQSRIPEEVYDRKTLESWYKSVPESTRKLLFFSLSDLCNEEVNSDVLQHFPDSLTTMEGTVAPIEYHFTPGEPEDGVTLVVPLEGLRQLEPTRLGWLVPGLLEQKIIAMLRVLPKDVRRHLVPIPDTAKQLTQELVYANGVLEEVLAKSVSRLVGQPIRPTDFERERIPDELKINIRVLSENGTVLGKGRELEQLQKELGVEAAKSIAAIDDPRWNRENLLEWNFGDLPEFIELSRGTGKIRAFPTLFDGKKSVSLQLSDSLDRAERETRLGVMRLFYLKTSRDLLTQTNWIPNMDRLRLYAQSLPEFDIKTGIAELIATRALEMDERPLPRNLVDFTNRFQSGKTRMGIAVQEVTQVMGSLLESYQQARLAIEQNKSTRFDYAWRDAKAALSELTAPSFLLTTPWNWLRQYPRYFRAVVSRFERLKSGGEQQDFAGTQELAKYWNMYLDRRLLHEASGIADPELELFRYMIEEYRVSLFAQKLGTSIKVSANRLDKQWDKVRN